jgi:hypothetical protein
MFDMGHEMEGYFVGPMPAMTFLDTFFPKSLLNRKRAKQFKKGCFDQVISCAGEIQAYNPFVGLFIVLTHCC